MAFASLDGVRMREQLYATILGINDLWLVTGVGISAQSEQGTVVVERKGDAELIPQQRALAGRQLATLEPSLARVVSGSTRVARPQRRQSAS